MQPLIERNVLTVEDPVEYRVPVACQTEVNRRAGYEFANAMRHFLRHDPDIILVGEIRDAETLAPRWMPRPLVIWCCQPCTLVASLV